ncbi:MAG: hypothetical protein ACRDS9_18720, partial [Pseudonocardiaceae bacterium]
PRRHPHARLERLRTYWCRISSRTLRELGWVICTITLPRYLSEPSRGSTSPRSPTRRGVPRLLQIADVGGNELMANAAIYSTALDITDTANQLAAEGYRSILMTWPQSRPTPSTPSVAWRSGRPG